MMNLRSFAIGMRIDQWLADQHPDLHLLQRQGMDALQQENLQLLSQRVGKLAIPVPLLGPVAAYALFADRLLGKTTYAIPFGRPVRWTWALNCSPSSTSCRPVRRTTASSSMPGPPPSA
jgi:hypothetical protein